MVGRCGGHSAARHWSRPAAGALRQLDSGRGELHHPRHPRHQDISHSAMPSWASPWWCQWRCVADRLDWISASSSFAALDSRSLSAGIGWATQSDGPAVRCASTQCEPRLSYGQTTASDFFVGKGPGGIVRGHDYRAGEPAAGLSVTTAQNCLSHGVGRAGRSRYQDGFGAARWTSSPGWVVIWCSPEAYRLRRWSA